MVLRKEIREASRDRGMLLHLVLIPLFLYPLLGFGAWQIFLLIEGSAERRPALVLLDASLPADLGDSLRTRPHLRVEEIELEAGVGRPREESTGTQVREGSTTAGIEAGATAERLPSIADFRHLRQQRKEDPPQVLLAWDATRRRYGLYHDSSRESSQRARAVVAEVVRARIERVEEERGRELGMSGPELRPFVIEAVDTASPRQLGRYLLSLLLPVLLVIMLPQGAYYATLDTVVGERERGTLETLITSPLQRGEIILGKFLFVTLSSLVSFALNLLSLGLFLGFVLQLMGIGDSIGVQPSLVDILVILVAATLTAAFLSAAMMVAAVGSRNYREGQTALMPLYLLPALAGLVIATQGDVLSPALAWIPVVNVAALLREVLRGQPQPSIIVHSLVSLLVFTSLSLAIAARIGRREEILFDPRLPLRRLLRWGLRSERKP